MKLLGILFYFGLCLKESPEVNQLWGKTKLWDIHVLVLFFSVFLATLRKVQESDIRWEQFIFLFQFLVKRRSERGLNTIVSKEKLKRPISVFSVFLFLATLWKVRKSNIRWKLLAMFLFSFFFFFRFWPSGSELNATVCEEKYKVQYPSLASFFSDWQYCERHENQMLDVNYWLLLSSVSW